jgi:hypothetical protein
MAAVGARRPERIGRGRGVPGSRSRGRISGGVLQVVWEVGEGLLHKPEGGGRGGIRVGRGGQEPGETAEGLPDGGGARVGLELEHRGRIGAARGELALGGEEDVGDREERVGAGQLRISLHRALREPLAADEVPRGEELARDLEPPGRVDVASAAAGGGGHVGWDWEWGSRQRAWGAAVRWFMSELFLFVTYYRC